jgi:phage gp45-like
MNLHETLRAWRAEVIEIARELAASMIAFSRYSLSTASGGGDKVEGHQPEGPGEEGYDLDARRVAHFGFRSRPPKGVWAVWLAVGGGSTNGVVVAEDSDRHGPSDLEDGEVALYCAAEGVEIRLDKDGNILIRAAAGKVVKLQDGDKGAARKDDQVTASSLMAAWMGQVEKALNVLASGAVQPLSDTFAGKSGIGTIAGASSKVLVG